MVSRTFCCLPLIVFLSSEAGAQGAPFDDPNRHACARPAEENVGKPGCFYNGSVDLGVVAGQRWWHIDEFPDIESAKKRQHRRATWA